MRSLPALPAICLLASVSAQVLRSIQGEWGPLINLPLVPAAGAVLHTGELLLWSAYADLTFQIDKSGQTQTVIYNLNTGSVTHSTVINTQHDMFCPGISTDFNGRIVITGGDTAAKTTIYNPGNSRWSAAAQMTVGRGYQSSTTTSDGRIFTIGGAWSGPRVLKDGEIYNPANNVWTALPRAIAKPMLTADAKGLYRADNHAWLFAWKNNFVLQAGPSKAMNWYGTTGAGSQTPAGTRGTDADSMCGVFVMYDAAAGKIFTAGGSPSYTDSPASARAHVITINEPGKAPAVEEINRMWFARGFANAVVLPDGKVLITGGQTRSEVFTDNNAVLTPELWNPVTKKFIKMAVESTPRTYHSISALMPDGRVFSGGGGLCGACNTNHPNGALFSPPYLFTATGAVAARPKIAAVSSKVVKLGRQITITTQTAVASFSLVRFGTVTHSTNTDQRRIPLTPTAKGLIYTVTIPGDAGVALPGYWMLFALNAAGVPSVAETILITL